MKVRSYNGTNGKAWRVDFYDAAGQRKRMQGFKTKSEAILEAVNPSQKRKRISFNDFSIEYMKHSKDHKRSWQRDFYSVKALGKKFGGLYLDTINTKMIEEYKHQRKKSVNPGTVNRELSCLKTMFNLAIKWNMATSNPCKGVKLYREKDRRGKVLEQTEIDRLLECCSHRLRPIVTTALHTGLRKSEILNLQWRHVDLDKMIIIITCTKSGEPRKVPINSKMIETLKALIPEGEHNPNDYVFCKPNGEPYKTIKRGFKSALKKAGIEEGYRFHDLRGTFATNLLESDVDVITIKELLGHSSLSMVLRYVKIKDTMKRKAVEVLC